MAKREYKIVLCWNGSKRQVKDTLVCESKWEWLNAIETMPYDLLDADDTTVWVDYGDNDCE